MKKSLILPIALATILSADSAMIKDKLMTKFPNLGEVTIQKTQVGELYEVKTREGIVYTDGVVWVVGNIIDFNGSNLTKKREDQLGLSQVQSGHDMSLAPGIDPSLPEKLDLSKALKMGSGKHQVILITDPECPYCHKVEKMLEGGDITRYIFLAPMEKIQTEQGERDFHKMARPLSLNILCREGKDQERVFKETFEGKFSAVKDLRSCATGTTALNTMKSHIEALVPYTRPIVIIDGKAILGANPIIKELIK